MNSLLAQRFGIQIRIAWRCSRFITCFGLPEKIQKPSSRNLLQVFFFALHLNYAIANSDVVFYFFAFTVFFPIKTNSFGVFAKIRFNLNMVLAGGQRLG